MILHKSLNFENIQLSHPRQNRSTGLSSRCLFKEKIQLGSEESPCSVIDEKLAVKNRKALKLSLTINSVNWFRDFETFLIKQISQKSMSWFDNDYSSQEVDRMFVSTIQNRNFIVLHYSNLLCYKMKNDDIIQIDPNDVNEGDIIIPKIKFEGIFIGKRHITPSFKILELLVVGENKVLQSSHPFKNVFEDNDILDPATFFENDNSSNGSFDTHVFTQ